MYKGLRFVVRIAFKIAALLMIIGIVVGVFFIRTTQAVSIFTVTNTNNAGTGSFRQAILDANATAGFDIISFNITGPGIKTIAPLSPLPIISDSVFIDGWSQGGIGYNGPPLIQLSGINVATLNIPGLRIGCFDPDCSEITEDVVVDDSTVRGLIINGFPSSNTLRADGIYMFGSNNAVRGCYIGTTANGEAALPNEGHGIRVRFGANNQIGGTTASARNVVSGNLGNGITIFAADNNRVQGNYVGLSASGLLDLGNGGSGVVVGGSNNLVGGASSGARNVISGNAFDGISLFNPFPAGFPLFANTRIEGNYIGTRPDGVTGGVGNDGWGVQIPSFSLITDNFIGGSLPGQGNVISSNGSIRGEGGGILLGSAGNRVQNNLIGVGADRTTNLGNLGDGIKINSDNNLIGGSLPFLIDFPAGNIIAFNHATGIRVTSGPNGENRISRNAIYSNDGLGIDLEPLGVTANDFCDFDTGPNNLQNFPIITSVTPAPGGGITITGRFTGTPGNHRVEFFNNANCDPSGNGEGEQFLGSVTATPQFPICRSVFVTTIPNITVGQANFITATATAPDGSTSEFSPCFAVH